MAQQKKRTWRLAPAGADQKAYFFRRIRSAQAKRCTWKVESAWRSKKSALGGLRQPARIKKRTFFVESVRRRQKGALGSSMQLCSGKKYRVVLLLCGASSLRFSGQGLWPYIKRPQAATNKSVGLPRLIQYQAYEEEDICIPV